MNIKQALNLLNLAIRNVSPSYVFIGNNYSDLHVERCFAYELYHQWSKLLEMFKVMHPRDNNLILSGEIPKDIGSTREKYPDIILHSGQDNGEKQLLVCEIKRGTASQSDILEDLNKLYHYLKLIPRVFNNEVKDVTYDHAVFIMTNCTKKQLITKIERICDYNENYTNIFNAEILDKITCIAVNRKGDKLKPEFFTLGYLVNTSNHNV